MTFQNTNHWMVDFRQRLGWLGTLAVVAVVVIVTVSLLAPWLAPKSHLYGELGDQFAPLSSNYLLGADENGRDILSRLIFGSRTSLLGPLAVILIALIVGVPLAIASAWKGGLPDVIIGRFLDLIFCFPPVLTAALIVTLFNHRGLVPAVVAVGIAYIPWTARITRSAALRERFLPYITACEVQGFSVFSICVRHMLPNLSRLIVAQSTIAFGHALVDIAALSFLGLAIQSPNPDWGLMVGSTGSIARGEYGQAIFAGILIIITVAAFSIIGNRISEDERN